MEALGNKLGSFVALEQYWEIKIDRRCVRILVEMELREGLFEVLKIEMHGISCYRSLITGSYSSSVSIVEEWVIYRRNVLCERRLQDQKLYG